MTEEIKMVKLEYIGDNPARTWHGGGSVRVVLGDVVEFPEDIAKQRMKEGLWKKVKAKKADKKKDGE